MTTSTVSEKSTRRLTIKVSDHEAIKQGIKAHLAGKGEVNWGGIVAAVQAIHGLKVQNWELVRAVLQQCFLNTGVLTRTDNFHVEAYTVAAEPVVENATPTAEARRAIAAQALCDIRNSFSNLPLTDRPLFLELMRAAECSLLGRDDKATRIAAAACGG